MIVIWRGWGALALFVMVPVVGSCAGLTGREPGWLLPAALGVTLLAGGAACAYYGTRWNRPFVEHTLYFIPLQVWGWVYIGLVAAAGLATCLTGLAFMTGAAQPGPRPNPNGPLYTALSGGVGLAAVAVGYLVVRAIRRPTAPVRGDSDEDDPDEVDPDDEPRRKRR